MKWDTNFPINVDVNEIHQVAPLSRPSWGLCIYSGLSPFITIWLPNSSLISSLEPGLPPAVGKAREGPWGLHFSPYLPVHLYLSFSLHTRTITQQGPHVYHSWMGSAHVAWWINNREQCSNCQLFLPLFQEQLALVRNISTLYRNPLEASPWLISTGLIQSLQTDKDDTYQGTSKKKIFTAMAPCYR